MSSAILPVTSQSPVSIASHHASSRMPSKYLRVITLSLFRMIFIGRELGVIGSNVSHVEIHSASSPHTTPIRGFVIGLGSDSLVRWIGIGVSTHQLLSKTKDSQVALPDGKTVCSIISNASFRNSTRTSLHGTPLSQVCCIRGLTVGCHHAGAVRGT